MGSRRAEQEACHVQSASGALAGALYRATPTLSTPRLARSAPLQLSPLRLVPVGTKAVDLDFDGDRLSSDAGLVLLHDPDAPLSSSRRSVLCSPDTVIRFNHPSRVGQRCVSVPQRFGPGGGAAEGSAGFPVLNDRSIVSFGSTETGWSRQSQRIISGSIAPPMSWL